MSRPHTVLFSADTISLKVNELAARIGHDHGDDGVQAGALAAAVGAITAGTVVAGPVGFAAATAYHATRDNE